MSNEQISTDDIGFVYYKNVKTPEGEVPVLHAYITAHHAETQLGETFDAIVEGVPDFVELKIYTDYPDSVAAEQLRVLFNPRHVVAVVPTRTIPSAIIMPGSGNRTFLNPLVQEVHMAGFKQFVGVEGKREEIIQKLGLTPVQPQAAQEEAPGVAPANP